MSKLEERVSVLESQGQQKSDSPKKKVEESKEDDEDVDLFGSGSDDEEEDAEKVFQLQVKSMNVCYSFPDVFRPASGRRG